VTTQKKQRRSRLQFSHTRDKNASWVLDVILYMNTELHTQLHHSDSTNQVD